MFRELYRGDYYLKLVRGKSDVGGLVGGASPRAALHGEREGLEGKERPCLDLHHDSAERQPLTLIFFLLSASTFHRSNYTASTSMLQCVFIDSQMYRPKILECSFSNVAAIIVSSDNYPMMLLIIIIKINF